MKLAPEYTNTINDNWDETAYYRYNVLTTLWMWPPTHPDVVNTLIVGATYPQTTNR